MLKLYRAIVDFLAGCVDALRDDEPAAAPERFEARRVG